MPKKPRSAKQVIFPGSRKPMDRRELQVALEPIIRAWLRATCTLLGFRTEELADDDEQDGAVLLRCRKRGRDTIVELLDEVDDEDLYRRVRFEAEVELPPEEREQMLHDPAAPAGAEPFASVSVVHALGGGVTLDWLIERILEWDQVLAEDRRAARARKRKDKVLLNNATVH